MTSAPSDFQLKMGLTQSARVKVDNSRFFRVLPYANHQKFSLDDELLCTKYIDWSLIHIRKKLEFEISTMKESARHRYFLNLGPYPKERRPYNTATKPI